MKMETKLSTSQVRGQIITMQILSNISRNKGVELASSHFGFWFFKKKKLSCYILFTDQISWSDSLYFLRYWAMCVF